MQTRILLVLSSAHFILALMSLQGSATRPGSRQGPSGTMTGRAIQKSEAVERFLDSRRIGYNVVRAWSIAQVIGGD